MAGGAGAGAGTGVDAGADTAARAGGGAGAAAAAAWGAGAPCMAAVGAPGLRSLKRVKSFRIVSGSRSCLSWESEWGDEHGVRRGGDGHRHSTQKGH